MRFARLATLAVCIAFTSLTSSSVVVAQSGPPPLVPFRGLVDDVTTAYWGFPTTGTSDGNVHSISGDGRHVVFSSSAWDLVAGDYNGLDDVFLRDRSMGTTTRLSVGLYGDESNGLSQQAAISTNGRHVVFASGATNLLDGDTNNHWDVFVRDLDANRTVRVSVSSTEVQGDADSYWPSISADGRYVVFISSSTTFAPNTVQYGPTQVYLHDRDTDGNGIFDEPGGTMTRFISLGADGTSPANQYCTRPRVSADGRYVMFESGASNLDPVGNSNGYNHLYVRDRLTSQNILIDRSVTGGPSYWGINWQVSDMSDDGRFITYSSPTPDIVPFDMNWQSQVFLYDAGDPTHGPLTTIVSRRSDGTLADLASYNTTVSADGRYVGFMTIATNLAAPAPTVGFGLVVYDGADGSFRRVDVLGDGTGFDGQYTFNPSLSADGTAIAFQSDAQNATGGYYSQNIYHSYVVTAFSASPLSASYPQAGGAGSIDVDTTPVSGWNAATIDPWIVLMDGAGFGAGPRTVQYLVSSNDSGIVRHGSIRVGSTVIAIHQDGDGDTTPPVITPIVTGTVGGGGWYTSDISIQWTIADPDSGIVSVSPGCAPATFTSDFILGTPTCEATSHGGTATVTVPLKRDTSAPFIMITTPINTIYPRGALVMPAFSCTDPYLYSGTASCTLIEGSSPLDTWTPGWHTVTVSATDVAGNSTTKSVEYLIGTDVCVTPPLVPAHLKAWLAFDGTMRERIGGLDAVAWFDPGTFQPAVAGTGWDNPDSTGYSNFLTTGTTSAAALVAGDGLTFAAWIRPRGIQGESGTIVDVPVQYRIARYFDGTLRWAFNTTAGFNWVNTGVSIPLNTWSHVAVTYKDGLVTSYLNGRLVHSAPLSGTLTTDGPNAGATLMGRYNVTATTFGTIDDVMFFDDALPDADIEGLVVAGGGSVCTPLASNMAITAVSPTTVEYHSVFHVDGVLTDGAGRALRYRNVTVTSQITPGYVWDTQLDANGSFHVTFPIHDDIPVGDYPDGITATFAGDEAFGPAETHAGITLAGITPPLTWSAPAPITYGTPLGAGQLNATSTVPGTLAYSPAAGTVLDAGPQTLSVTFTPTLSIYAQRTMTTAIDVNKMTPAIGSIGDVGEMYNGQPHVVSIRVTGINDEALTPVVVTYNGSTTAPTNAGSYAVESRYDGSANYNAVSRTGTLTVGKAAPSLTWATPSPINYGTALGASQLNAAASVAGTFSYAPAAGTVLNAGTQALNASFAPDDATNYLTGSVTATLSVSKANPTVTWSNPSDIVYGTALTATQLNATANIAGTFAYLPAAGTVLSAGSHALNVTFTPDDAVNYNGTSASVTLNIAKATTTITWAAPNPIVYGTALGGAQLNATASVPGTVVYSPAAGTMFGAGSQTLSATFTPTDTSNYTGSSASRPLTVAAAPLTIRAVDSSKVFGAPLPAFSASGAGFVNGDSFASLIGSLTFSTSATAASAVGGYAVT
ncbi:MAG TPA: LamG-like jellyroll fold domain-containing protein, partial [Vicinamibacterales bacterium]|nr:LamG-like jellyroll fold domain-containing protein [Vicinamibacterales bacterium]